MGCLIHCVNPQLLYKTINTRSKQQSTCSSVQPRTTFYTSFSKLNDQQLVSTATIQQSQIQQSDLYNVKFKTLGGCKLGISRYPDFEYDAEGGAGSGRASKTLETDLNGEALSVDFDVKEVYIPPLSASTTRFLGLPLPPFLKIDIVPEVFQGKINQESGEVNLKFRAKFWFSIGNMYKAPPLLVETVLTSEESKGKIRRGRGERLNEEGICRLVGVATVEPINDFFMDTFLNLPTECLAGLNAIISLSSTA